MRLSWLAAASVIALATHAHAAPDSGPRVLGELGVAPYSGTYVASRETGEVQSGRGGINGPAVRLRVGVGYAITPRFVLGPMAGVDTAFTRITEELCCGSIDRADTARLGIEGGYYPFPHIGFRIQAGFGYAITALRPDASGRARPGVLGAVSLDGVYGTVALARDYAVTRNVRIGGVLRLEVDALSGRNGDHVFSLHTFTPSLSLVVLTNGPTRAQ